MDIIIELILKVLDLYALLILVNILGTWIDPYNQIIIFQWIRKITEPYLRIFRIVIPIGNMNFDVSAILGLMVIEMIRAIFIRTASLGMF
ncbi:YggT family protein [Leptotrichia shahii]|uniref:YggT family protein n=1 Tax=Leptotrichia shahii TaxID=157691 RepID=UPI0028D41613|nr:YggT family protein [Leptotrichia shahii]